MEFFHKTTRFPFMRTRKIWYGLSAVLIASSLVLVAVRGLNLGIDFTGGIVVETNFPQTPNIEQLRGALAQAGVGGAQVQAFGSSRDILVRLPPDTNAQDPNAKGDQIGARILDIFRAADAGVRLQRTEVVGPQVGQELFVKGAWALVATLVLILIYVLLRFTPKLALGAIFAVLHDPICVLGFFAVSQITFDLTAISAILAVIGYSLNDTVIVFDRVRERARTARKLSIAQVIDDSINQTLSRTLMTKLVTLLVVVALLIFGGETLHGFSAALVIGIIAGTYSSIYISAALALDLGLRTDDLLERKLTKPEEVDGLP
jgi:preprotein translocase subunit SecF